MPIRGVRTAEGHRLQASATSSAATTNQDGDTRIVFRHRRPVP